MEDTGDPKDTRDIEVTMDPRGHKRHKRYTGYMGH